MRCYLYMIKTTRGGLYTGITNNIERRWNEHKSGRGAKYLKMNGFDKPVYLRKFKNKSEAMRKEVFIKRQSKVYKDELITSNSNIIDMVVING